MVRRISAIMATSRRFSSMLAMLLVVVVSGTYVFAAPQPDTLPSGKRDEIEKAVSAFMSAHSVPGISIAIVQGGQPVWSSGFGLSDLEDSAPATSSTLYRLGSICVRLHSAWLRTRRRCLRKICRFRARKCLSCCRHGAHASR